MKIAIDLDDTLSVVDRVTRASGYIARNNLPFKLVDENAHELEKVFNWSLPDVLQFIREGGITVFTDAEARPGARETLQRLREEGHEITVLTARTREWFVNPEKVSRDWLEKRRMPYDEIVADVPDKGAYCAENGISVLIDDSVDNFTKSNCEYKEDGEWKSEPTLSATVLRIKSDIKEQLDYQLQEICEGMDGYWVEYEDSGTTLPAFYREVAGGNITNIKSGRCVQNDTMVQCLAFNSDTEKSDTAIATYSETRDECAFSDEWYARQCTFLGNGYYENGICYVAKP